MVKFKGRAIVPDLPQEKVKAKKCFVKEYAGCPETLYSKEFHEF